MQPMVLHPKSRAYDPSYRPTRSLAQLVTEHPGNQFMADRLAEQVDAIERQRQRVELGRAWVERLKARLHL
jgi:hypothetical protein